MKKEIEVREVKTEEGVFLEAGFRVGVRVPVQDGSCEHEIELCRVKVKELLARAHRRFAASSKIDLGEIIGLVNMLAHTPDTQSMDIDKVFKVLKEVANAFAEAEDVGDIDISQEPAVKTDDD